MTLMEIYMCLLVVKNLVNSQQNNDIINLCRRADLGFYQIDSNNIAGSMSFTIDNRSIVDILNKNKWYLTLGSHNLAMYLKESGFIYGHNLNNLSQDIQKNNWDSSIFLNNDAKIIYPDNVEPFLGKMFLRPVNDSKSFNAGIYSFNELTGIIFSEKLLASSIKQIEAEYRFVIIKGKIADNSSYKIGNRIDITSKAPNAFYDFVENLIDKWMPTENFVIDIANHGGKPKIIEVNNIHCSRFYGCSLEKIIEKALF